MATNRAGRVATSATARRIEVLVDTALRGIPRLLDPHTGVFVFTVSPAGRAGHSLRYTCMTLIGLTAATRAGFAAGLDLDRLVRGIADRRREITNPGELGLLLWCLSDYRQTLTDAHDEVLARIPTARVRLDRLTATELGWLVSGLSRTAQMAPGRGDIADKTHTAYAALRANYAPATALFCYGGEAGGALRRHLRRRFGFFDNQVYGICAGADYARAFGDRDALTMATRCLEQVVHAQGPLGQWAWHYDVRTGAVVDRYPVYSVHQHGMGPMALNAVAEATGRSLTDALEPSLTWLFGNNELRRSMLDAEHGVIWRSIRRRVAPRRQLHAFKLLSLMRLQRARSRLAALLDTPRQFEVDMECRPYELGWLLLGLARR